jgi:glycosyltransferase involved in cell wall biosynthesis
LSSWGASMHILMFLASTGKGGAESLVVNLCNQLVTKHQVSVLFFNESEWIDQLDSAVSRFSVGNKSSRNNPLLYFRIVRALDHVKPDIIHLHGAKAASVFKRLGKLVSFPCVATKHNSRKGRVFDELQHVVAVSGEVASTISHKVPVIYNGIVANESVAPEVSENAFKILGVGRLDRIKGFERLISAMRELPDHVQLEIAGDGDEYASLKRQIEELQLEKRVTLLGFRSDIRKLMAKAHLVVISSYSEGFSLVLVESLFYANVLLSTKVGGAEEVLPEELLVEHSELADKLRTVSQDYQYYKNVFTKCKSRCAGRFTVEKMAESYEAYYSDVLQQQAKY